MINIKAVIIASVISILIVLMVVGYEIKKLNSTDYIQDKSSIAESNTHISDNNTLDTAIENTVIDRELEKNEVKEQETLTQNEIEHEDEKENQVNRVEVTTAEENEKEENNKEKALKLVKEEWGEDDTVYYYLDNQSGNKYFFSVRSKSTTASVAEYEVDVSNNTVTMK